MQGKRQNLCLVAILVGLIGYARTTPVGYSVTQATGYTVIGTSQKSTLYQVETADDAYDWPIYLIDLHGSRVAMGYDFGKLWGQKLQQMYWTFLERMIGDSYEDEFFEEVLGPALDWQWDNWLEAELPDQYKQELAGIGLGGKSVGVEGADLMIQRIVTLANLPGDIQDMVYVLIREWNASIWHHAKELKRNTPEKVSGLQCSMFGIWGSRTTDGSLLSARNLDWNKDLGIAQFKLITVYHPDDGSYVHATVGFAGLWGAIAGMSAKGLTVHEANLEETEISFGGFPWVMRLRYIMENAANLGDAYVLWERTNNTVGFNHMIGSAVDAKSMVEETMYEYTAYFLDNDPREQNATYTDPKSGQVIQIGFPMKEAVYRTNHGYDPKIRAHYEWSQAPDSWSMRRYMMFYEGFKYYEEAGIKLGELEAVNMTSIVADKGSSHPYLCEDNTDGGNVLSVTFHPGANKLYAAWEDGTGDSWRPACCNNYVMFDMTRWWNSQPNSN